MLDTKSWTSYYDDDAYGASIEFGDDPIAGHTLKGALHWRRDNHTEWQKTHATSFVEPRQDTNEESSTTRSMTPSNRCASRRRIPMPGKARARISARSSTRASN
ncbi:MAG: hypothetical protein LBE06_00465, partial [Azoarcus sp.]|nr:hypothetical protein [Azoarcus sp.]